MVHELAPKNKELIQIREISVLKVSGAEMAILPKIDNAFFALNGGVQSVIIGKAEKLHELINGTAGTTITN